MKDKTNHSFWNRFAGIYDLFMKKDKNAYKNMYELIRARVGSDMRVLELATGTGLISIAIADCVSSIEATDFSPKMIAEAEKKKIPGNVIFSVQDACNLPYGNDSFDCVIISNALHIMPDPELALENIHRVLKNDGILIAPTFTHAGNGRTGKAKAKLMALFGFKAFHKWTSGEYFRFLENNGFYIEYQQVIESDFPLTYVEAKKKSRKEA
jgi:phosphatidylethanolamine/phosphatidyl-N-methylethanolamine N-methyltransferase